MKRILVDGGFYEEGKYYFYLRDHLGNNRVVADASGSAIQVTHYYPFGMSFTEGYEKEGVKPAKQPYRYNGKELDEENSLNWYDYEARQLTMDVPRFATVDPLAEKYYSISPYAYVMNNPLKYIDPNGEDVVYFDEEGKELSRITSNERFETYYKVANGTEGAVNSELTPLAGVFLQATMPGLKAGTNYVDLDYQIAASTGIMNDKIASLLGLPATANHQYTSDSEVPLLDVNVIKAIVMNESNMGAPGGNGTGTNDPMQANYPGDWNASKDVKQAIGLTKNQTMTPQTSLNAGIGIFLIKGMNSDSRGNYTTWKGNNTAVKNYNGGGDKNYMTKFNRNYGRIAP